MTADYRWLGRIALALLIGKMLWVLYVQDIQPWWWRYPMLLIVGGLLAAIVKINTISDWLERRWNEGKSMEIKTSRGDLGISIEDIPNVENLTSLDINLMDGTVNFYFKGWVPIFQPSEVVVTEELQGDPNSTALPEAKA